MVKSSRNIAVGIGPAPFRSELVKLLGDPVVVDEAAVEERADLLATIQNQIIPQLVLAHIHAEPSETEACADARLPPTAEEVVAFAALAVNEDVPAALEFVQAIASAGISLEVILLHLLTPAARLLGDQWLEDERSFTEVTVGLATLQQVVQILRPRFAPGAPDRGFVLLMAPAPDQHTLPIYLVGEFLRRAGWGVQVAPNLAESDLLALLAEQRVDMVGISVSNSDLLRPVTRMVAAVKKASINPDVLVMLGGSVELAAHASQIGATFCSDPRDAVRWLEQHVKFVEVGK